MNRYLIPLNGSPFLIVTCLPHMDPIQAARSYLLHGNQDGVTVEPVGKT